MASSHQRVERWLDFFIRHGILTFENEPNYITSVSRLQRGLEVVRTQSIKGSEYNLSFHCNS